MVQKVVIIDYGVGNLHSVYKKLLELKAEVFISQSPKEITRADKIILPGVGHFGKALRTLSDLHLIDALYDEVLLRKKPVLGICLGMQLMAQYSEEAPEVKGLGWLENKVIRFQQPDTLRYKIPHIGWNKLRMRKTNQLMQDIPESAEFYFLHSYHFSNNTPPMVLCETDYGYTFVSAIAEEHIFGVQFHPEKSHDCGTILFQNFLNL